MNHEYRGIEQMDDETLLAALGRALDAADPVPGAVTEFAKAALGWRTIDAELAALVFDSAAEELVGVRSDSDTREVTFAAPGVEIEVTVVGEERRRLVGQLVPPQAATVELRAEQRAERTETDELGRFVFEDVPSGPVSLRCTLGDTQTVQTQWLIM